MQDASCSIGTLSGVVSKMEVVVPWFLRSLDRNLRVGYRLPNDYFDATFQADLKLLVDPEAIAAPAQTQTAFHYWKTRVDSAMNALTATADGHALVFVLIRRMLVAIRVPADVEEGWPTSFSKEGIGLKHMGATSLSFPHSTISQDKKTNNITGNPASAAASLLSAASMLGCRRPIGVCSPLIRLPEDYGSGSVAGRPIGLLQVSPMFSDYCTWMAPDCWSLEKMSETSKAWFKDRTVVNAFLNGAGIKGLAAWNSFPIPDQAAKVRDYRLSTSAGSAPPAWRDAVESALSKIVTEGWVQTPLPVAIAHEFLHMILRGAEGVAAPLVQRAMEYVVDSDVRKSIDALFGEKPSAAEEIALADGQDMIVQATADGWTTDELLNYLRSPKAAKRLAYGGMLLAANRVIESAAVFGASTVVGQPTPPAGTDELTASIWNVSENSIRTQFGIPKRGAYAHSLSGSSVLCLPSMLGLKFGSGCTGGRYPWAPEGLAKLCGTEKSHPWFQ